MIKPIRTYRVKVDGHEAAFYSARSPGKARVRAWRDYGVCSDCSFKEFMKISRCTVEPDPPGIYRRIVVGGTPATTVIGYGQYVSYMRDDSDTIVCSHPSDVTYLPEALALSPHNRDATTGGGS